MDTFNTHLAHIVLVASCAALSSLLAACCLCMGGDPPRCSATLKHTGGDFSKSKPFIAEAKGATKDSAIDNACKDYCYSADPTYDEKFKEWVNKPENSHELQRYEKDPRHSKEWGIMGNSSMQRALELCTAQCANAAKNKKDKKFTVQAECAAEE